VATGWPPEGPRPTPKPPRRAGEYPAAKPEGDIASRRESWAQAASDISAIEELLMEHKVALREQKESLAAQAKMEIMRALKTEESAAMTMLKKSRKGWLSTAVTLAAILLSSTAILITRLATWADAREAAIEPAHEAKEVARGVEERVGRGEERLDSLEGTLGGIERDLGVLGRKLDRLIDEQESEPGRRR
jgi:hypothetical protein